MNVPSKMFEVVQGCNQMFSSMIMRVVLCQDTLRLNLNFLIFNHYIQ